MVRFKNRWLLIEFIPLPSTAPQSNVATITGKQVFSALKQSVLAHFGDAGWGAVGYSLTVKYFSPTTQLCIVRVGREHVRVAWGAATLLSTLEGQKIVPNVIHVSGTIKHAQLAAIQHNRTAVARLRAQAGTPAGYADSYNEFLQTSEIEIQALQD